MLLYLTESGAAHQFADGNVILGSFAESYTQLRWGTSLSVLFIMEVTPPPAVGEYTVWFPYSHKINHIFGCANWHFLEMLAYYHNLRKENQVRGTNKCLNYHFKEIKNFQRYNHHLGFLTRPKMSQLYANDINVNVAQDTILGIFKHC